MTQLQLEAHAEQLTEQLQQAARVILQLEPVNRAIGQLFHSTDAGRVVTADASANGVVIAARWRSPTVTVARPWFVAQLTDHQQAIVDLYTAHVTAVVADIKG